MSGPLAERLVASLGIGRSAPMRQEGASALEVPVGAFAEAASVMAHEGARLAGEWGEDETGWGRGFRVWAAYQRGAEYLLVTAPLKTSAPSFPSLGEYYASAYRFERQIFSLLGIVPDGLPDNRPWIKHEDWPAGFFPLRKNVDGSKPMSRLAGEYEWIRAEGEGVYEIPVGPVHAGVIEPGHFRFQAVGEKILNLEAKLGYVHKGIEKRFESVGWAGGARLAGRVSGDTTVAHALAYSMAVERACGMVVPRHAGVVRALMLERERIANHLGDLAAICNDVAFTFAYYQFWNLRERVLRTNRAVFGHRLMMDVVVPGGVAGGPNAGWEVAVLAELGEIMPEFERTVDIMDDSPSVKDRLFNTGKVSRDLAAQMGLVGLAGKASGLDHDARKTWTFPPYDIIAPRVHLLNSGDAHARAWVRVEEVRDSARMIREMLKLRPDGEVFVSPPPVPPEARGFSAVEGWRGEILYWVHAGPDGGVARCMVRDPSAVNWLALEQSVMDDMVPDFPLANKSFNNSYSGNDL